MCSSSMGRSHFDHLTDEIVLHGFGPLVQGCDAGPALFEESVIGVANRSLGLFLSVVEDPVGHLITEGDDLRDGAFLFEGRKFPPADD